MLAPWGPLEAALAVWMNVYTLLALKRVHGGSWRGTLMRASLIALLHLMLLGLAFMIDVLWISLM